MLEKPQARLFYLDRKASLEVFQASVINNAFELLANELHMGEIFKFVRGPFGGSLKKNIFVEEGFAVYEQQHAIKNQCNDFRYFISQEKFNALNFSCEMKYLKSLH